MPVNPLAALDRAIAHNIERGAAKGSPSDRDLREARQAMATLMAAARMSLALNRVTDGLRDAMANIGGQ